MSWWSRLANVVRSGSLQRELDEELQFHIAERTRELIAAGMTHEAAATEAARRFGSPLRLREASLDVKLLPWLDAIARDVRMGARLLRKHAGVTSAAVLSLALALGACLAAFSLVDALILRPLPVQQPERLIYLTFPTYTAERPEADTFSDPMFLRLRDAGRGRVDLFAMSTQVIRPARFAGADSEKEPVRTQYASGDAFERLGILPAAGRLLTTSDDTPPGAHPVAIVSHAFWMRRFGGDPGIVGRWFTIEERPFQIVGVAERRFAGIEPGRPTDVWLPYAMYNPRAFGNFQFGWFRILGRVKENVRFEEAQSVLHAAFTAIRRDIAPRTGFGPNRSAEDLARFVNTPLYVRPAGNGPSPLRREFERSLWTLASIAALVLLIAGSNVANLFLARMAAREHEMALRLSIGAGRARLIQQVLIESALIAAAACVLGLLFAGIAAPTVVGMLASSDDPVHLDLRMNWRLAAFAGGLALLTTALFGLAPAVRASGVAPIGALKASGGRVARAGVMRPFIAVQVAFGLVVLFVGSLLVLSFAKLSSVNPGFATSDVLVLSLEAVQRVDPQQQRRAVFEVLDRLRGIPGVQQASAAEFNPLGRAWTHYVPVPGTEHENIEATMAPVANEFFETMRIPLLGGRTFTRADVVAGPSTAIVINEAFAARYFGRNSAVGRTLEARFGEDSDAGVHEVVGVVADTRYDLRKPAAPTIYIPLALRHTSALYVRVAADTAPIRTRLRDAVRDANSIFRATSIKSQAAAVDQTLIRERLLAQLSGFFALVGVALAAVGLYGILSYSVVQRTREIGIRLALGARQLTVVQTLLAESGATVLVGAACGLAGGLYVSRFMQSLLFEVKPLDFWSLALPLATLALAALLAAALPSVRAARVDPVIALRYE